MMKKYSYIELGMVFGMFIGSGIGLVAFIITKNASFLIIPIWGVFLGLVIGSLLDKRRKQ
jgi:hypothetical protein